MSNLTFLSSQNCVSSSFIENIYSSVFVVVSSLYDDNEDGNSTFPTHPPLVESIEHKCLVTPYLPRSVHTTC